MTFLRSLERAYNPYGDCLVGVVFAIYALRYSTVGTNKQEEIILKARCHVRFSASSKTAIDGNAHRVCSHFLVNGDASIKV